MNQKVKKLFAQDRVRFPDPELTLEDGLVDVGDNLSVESLLEAYSFGIFPWPQDGVPTLWFSPPERGILDFANYRISTKFKKFLKKSCWSVRWNTNFSKVLEHCQKASRPGQEGTWITQKIFNAYIEFHEAGYAHSIECYEKDELVGGLYGVYVGGVFCGESMFFLKSSASKFCLHYLVESLQGQGMQWMDIQMVTPYLESVGAQYISRVDFLKRLEESKKKAQPFRVSSSIKASNDLV